VQLSADFSKLGKTSCRARNEERLVTLLGKVKSFFQLIGRRSIRGAGQEIHREFSNQPTTGKAAPDPVKLDQIQNRSAGIDERAETSTDRLLSSISKEIPIPDFEVEESAEDYFFANQGRQAQGTFQKVDAVRWEHDEADWCIEKFDFQPSDKVSIPRLPPSPALMKRDLNETKRLSPKEIQSSNILVRRIASERSWLSPKSSRALAKLGDKRALLSRSETNALNYLLDRCANVPELREDGETLRATAANYLRPSE